MLIAGELERDFNLRITWMLTGVMLFTRD